MTMLRTSPEVVALGHFDAVYLFHERYGYILEMSADVHALWAAFSGGSERTFIEREFGSKLTGQTPSELIDILSEFSCLLPPSGESDKWLDYIPVFGAWNTWEKVDGVVSVWTAWGDREPQVHSLSEKESAAWSAIDGETRVSELAARFGENVVLPLLAKLSSLEIQAIKLSPVPLSVYGGRHRWPAYLTSTMPYPPIAEASGTPKLADYHQNIADVDAQFDDVETTLAHLFRREHEALADRTYGQALLEGLEKDGLVLGPEPLRVVEIGGGLGEVSASILDAAEARGFSFDYTIVEMSPSLAARQRERTGGRAKVQVQDVLAATFAKGSIDLVIANEMIGDLPVTKANAEAELVERFGLDVEGADDDTVINSGAIALVELISGWLAPEGVAVLTEFGERSQFPRLSSHLDHPEYSIHFGHLLSASSKLELDGEMVFLMDLIDMRRDLEGLATTRSQFRALAALLDKRGVTFEKVGYTRGMFAKLTEGIEDGELGDLRYDKIEDRLMGLVPHEFKALIVRRTPPASTP